MGSLQLITTLEKSKKRWSYLSSCLFPAYGQTIDEGEKTQPTLPLIASEISHLILNSSQDSHAFYRIKQPGENILDSELRRYYNDAPENEKEMGFSDIEGHWAYESIAYVYTPNFTMDFFHCL